MKLNEKFKKILNALIFTSIIWFVFVHCTYLLRGNKRDYIAGLKTMDENSIDVIFVGASNVFTYWRPVKGWTDCGITSFDYTSSGMDAETYPFLIRECLKTQHPKVFVVDVRKLLTGLHDDEITVNLRNGIDSMPMNLNRFKAINYFCDLNGIPKTDAISLYFDIIQYHDNYSTLKSDYSWDLWDNIAKNQNYLTAGVGDAFIQYFTRPENETDAISKLPAASYAILEELMKVCNENDVELLLVASPFYIQKEQQEEMNAVSAFANEFHVPFIDMNKRYDEIGVNFESDFMDRSHANISGSSKYMAYLENYLIAHYSIPDHRDDYGYERWKQMAKSFEKDENACYDEYKENLRNIQITDQKINEMMLTDSAMEWLAIAKDHAFSVAVFASESSRNKPNIASEGALRSFGLTKELLSDDRLLGLVIGDEVVFCEDNYSMSGDAGSYHLYGRGESLVYDFLLNANSHITIDNREYFSAEPGIHFVAIDVNKKKLADSVIISITQDGELALLRTKS